MEIVALKVIKSRFVQLTCLILVVFPLANCSSTSKSMDTWKGHHKSELYQKWGPPSRTTDDGLGGEILIYEKWVDLGQTAGQVYQNPGGSVSYTTPQQEGYLRTRMFYVNKNGVIYSWRWQGW